MNRALAAAVLERLRADPALLVHDGDVPDLPQLPYVVLWTAAPRRSTDRLSGQQVNATSRFHTMCVGATQDQVRATQQHVHELLVDARLVLPGRALTRVRHDAADTIRYDTDSDPHVYLGGDAWSVLSVPQMRAAA